MSISMQEIKSRVENAGYGEYDSILEIPGLLDMLRDNLHGGSRKDVLFCLQHLSQTTNGAIALYHDQDLFLHLWESAKTEVDIECRSPMYEILHNIALEKENTVKMIPLVKELMMRYIHEEHPGTRYLVSDTVLRIVHADVNLEKTLPLLHDLLRSGQTGTTGILRSRIHKIISFLSVAHENRLKMFPLVNELMKLSNDEQHDECRSKLYETLKNIALEKENALMLSPFAGELMKRFFHEVVSDIRDIVREIVTQIVQVDENIERILPLLRDLLRNIQTGTNEDHVWVYEIIGKIAEANLVAISPLVDDLMRRSKDEERFACKSLIYSILWNLAGAKENKVEMFRLVDELLKRSREEEHDECRSMIYKTLGNISAEEENSVKMINLVDELMKRAKEEMNNECRSLIYYVIMFISSAKENQVKMFPLVDELIKRSLDEKDDNCGWLICYLILSISAAKENRVKLLPFVDDMLNRTKEKGKISASFSGLILFMISSESRNQSSMARKDVLDFLLSEAKSGGGSALMILANLVRNNEKHLHYLAEAGFKALDSMIGEVKSFLDISIPFKLPFLLSDFLQPLAILVMKDNFRDQMANIVIPLLLPVHQRALLSKDLESLEYIRTIQRRLLANQSIRERFKDELKRISKEISQELESELLGLARNLPQVSSRILEEFDQYDISQKAYDLKEMLTSYVACLEESEDLTRAKSRLLLEGKTLEVFKREITDSLLSIRKATECIGSKLPDRETEEWKLACNQRDQHRELFIKTYQHLERNIDLLRQLYSTAMHDSAAEKLEVSMRELVDSLPDTQTPLIDQSTSQSSSFVFQSPVIDTGFQASSQNQDWAATFHQRYCEKVQPLQEKVFELMTNLESAARELSNAMAESDIRHHVSELKSQVNFAMVRRKEHKEGLKKGLEFLGDFQKSFDIENELQMKDRRDIAMNLLKRLNDVNTKVREARKAVKQLEADEEDDHTEESLKKLLEKKKQAQPKLAELKGQFDGLQNEILMTCRMFNDGSFLDDDSYDFPDIAYQVLNVASLKSSAPSKEQELLLMLQKSGLLMTRSLGEDYVFDDDDLPDEAKRVMQENQKIRIVRLRRHEGAASMSIKVLKQIPLSEVKQIRGAVLFASRIRHPGILPVEGVFLEQNSLYVQTPFRAGGSMHHWLQVKERSMDCKLRVLIQAAEALSLLHESGIIHRDIKMENVVMDSLDDSAIPSWCDFDLSKDTILGQTQTTHRAGAVGTYRYMAPEVYSGEKSCEKSGDVWSFVMLAMIALVFDGKYEEMKSIPQNPHRVDLQAAQTQAIDVLPQGKFQSFLDVMNRVLIAGDRTPSIRDVALSIEQCDLRICYLCEMESSSSKHRLQEGCECDNPGAEKHFLCTHHFRGHVSNQLERGEIRCAFGNACVGSHPFKEQIILERAGPELLEKLFRARECLIQRERENVAQRARLDGERAGREQGLREAEAKKLADVQILRVLAKLDDLSVPRCPRCKVATVREGGCAAMTCTSCGCGYCALCFLDCGRDAHPHVTKCPQRVQGLDHYGYANNEMINRDIFESKIRRDMMQYVNEELNVEMRDSTLKDDRVLQYLRNVNLRVANGKVY